MGVCCYCNLKCCYLQISAHYYFPAERVTAITFAVLCFHGGLKNIICILLWALSAELALVWLSVCTFCWRWHLSHTSMSEADANVCLVSVDVLGWKQLEAMCFVSADCSSAFRCQTDSRLVETSTTVSALYLVSPTGWAARKVNN